MTGDCSRLEVSEGRVALRSPHGVWRVGPGEQASATATSAPTLERWCFRFADGVSERSDAKWWLGTLVNRADGRRALASQAVVGADGAWHGCRVTLLGDTVSAPSWRLRIRAEVPVEGGALVVQPHNLSQGQNYQIHVPVAAGSGILDLDLALDQGRALSDRSQRWSAGDVLDEVLIYQSGTGEGGLVLHEFSLSVR